MKAHIIEYNGSTVKVQTTEPTDHETADHETAAKLAGLIPECWVLEWSLGETIFAYRHHKA